MCARRYRLGRTFCFAALLWCALAAAWSAEAAWIGRPLTEVLDELRGPGLQFIYSSQLLPASLRVMNEPRARDRLGVAREVLAAHELELSAVGPGVYAVVRRSARAHVGEVRGRISDVRTSEPIHGARIELAPLPLVTWSDGQGRFAIRQVPAGEYTLRVSAGNYVSRDIPGVSTATAEKLEVGLEPAPVGIAEVVVATSRYASGDEAPTGSLLLEGSQLAAQPSLGDDSIRALAHLPGIAENGASAQSNVRGGETGEVLILLDGYPLRQAFHLPGYQSLFSVVDPGLIGEAEVFTGGFPVRYGNRLSGVFDLRTASATREPRRALGVSFFNAMARYGAREESWDAEWVAAGRVGTLKPLLQAVAPEAGDPSYSDVYGRVVLGDVDRLRLSGNFLWARDELSISAEDRGEQADIESRSRYAWLRADHEWGNGLLGSVWLGHSRIDSVRDGSVENPGVAVGEVEDSRASQFWDAQVRLAWQPSRRHWFEAGGEWTSESADYRYRAAAEYPGPIARLFDRDRELSRTFDIGPSRNRVAVFGAHRWRMNDAVTSELGLRVQRILTRRTDSEWISDPRVSLRWQLAPRTSLRAHWGRFHQADEIQELKVEDGQTTFPPAQRADHLIVGLEHHLTGGVALRAEAFRKDQSSPRPRFENILNPLSLIPELAPDRTLIAPDFAEIRGLEVSVVQEDLQWTRWAAVTWSEALDEIDDRDVPRSWDQTWALSAGVEWTRGAWRLGALTSVHEGWPRTRLIQDASGATRLGPRNRDRLPTFATVDLRAEYRRPLDVGSIAFALEVTNALNRRNPCCEEILSAERSGLGTALETERLDWLPFVPSLSVMWEY